MNWRTDNEVFSFKTLLSGSVDPFCELLGDQESLPLLFSETILLIPSSMYVGVYVPVSRRLEVCVRTTSQKRKRINGSFAHRLLTCINRLLIGFAGRDSTRGTTY